MTQLQQRIHETIERHDIEDSGVDFLCLAGEFDLGSVLPRGWTR